MLPSGMIASWNADPKGRARENRVYFSLRGLPGPHDALELPRSEPQSVRRRECGRATEKN